MKETELFRYNDDKRWTFETTDIKEILFKHMVEGRVVADYKKDFKEIGLTTEAVESFDDVFFGDDSFSEREREMFCTVPYEVRLKQFNSFFAENHIDKKDFNRDSWKEFVKYIIELNIDLDPHIGFHATPNVIPRDKVEGEVRGGWSIKGTEHDHRNNDQLMAFYSLSLEKLFRQKNIGKLYIVRSNLANGYNHYPDNDGHWGRSGNLSIISEIDFTDEDSQILDEMATQLEDEKAA